MTHLHKDLMGFTDVQVVEMLGEHSIRVDLYHEVEVWFLWRGVGGRCKVLIYWSVWPHYLSVWTKMIRKENVSRIKTFSSLCSFRSASLLLCQLYTKSLRLSEQRDLQLISTVERRSMWTLWNYQFSFIFGKCISKSTGFSYTWSTKPHLQSFGFANWHDQYNDLCVMS